MKIFLTGGTGFIGSYVLNLALERGIEVVATRRTACSQPVIELSKQPTWIERSLNEINKNDLKHCDVVLHLASAGVSPKVESLQTMVDVNVSSTIRLIELAYNAGVSRIVMAGTCHEYGQSALNYEAVPADASLQPSNLYGASKAAGFELVSSFARVHKLKLYYGRIFSAYGEGQFEGNFWPLLAYAAKNGLDFNMTKGTQVRDFMEVQDVALKFIEACKRPDLLSGKPYIENIGSGKATSLLDFATSEWIRLGATGRILPGTIPDRPGDVDRLVPLLNSN